ncbi:MAG TPA: substrate-binding domain-containing protein [Ruminococcus sp.]|nr:substrate-binding domain-containing protein [Ruminococcus sp.]
MESIGRIALVLPHVSSALDSDLISGVFSSAKKYGYDIVVMTGIINAKTDFFSNGYSDGLDNIYSLLDSAELDGVIFFAGGFSSEQVKENIFRSIQRRALPCVVIGEKRDGLSYVFPDQRAQMKCVTRHLIEQHGCRNIYCITGMEEDYVSLERLAGFGDAMDEAGISYDSSSVFYGYFCKEIPRQIGIDIAKGKIPFPDGIVCASDAMAVSLCHSLKKCGVEIPGQIAVAGYGGSWEALVYTPRITTALADERGLGAEAFDMLLKQIGYSVSRSEPEGPQIRIGTSCGCCADSVMSGNADDSSIRKFMRKTSDIYTERRNYISSDLIGRMSSCSSIERLMEEADKLSYMLMNWESMDICLCTDWKFDMDSPQTYRMKGYSDDMILALSKTRYSTGKVSSSFSSDMIIPAMDRKHEPRVYVLTSLHCRRQIFGYICTSYKKPRDIFIDEYYVNWCDALANGMNIIQNRLHHEYLRQQFESLTVIDPSSGLFNRRGLIENISRFSAITGNSLIAVYVLAYVDHKEHRDTSPLSAISNVLRGTGPDMIAAVPEENVIVCAERCERRAGEAESIKTFKENLKRTMDDLYNGAVKPDFERIAVICRYLGKKDIASFEDTLTELCSTAKGKAMSLAAHSEDYREKLDKIRMKFMENPQLDWSIDSISKDIGISRSHLQRLYKEQFGSSCMDDIISARLSHAKWLLVNTDLKIGQIAEQCGYFNESHFMRQFKSKMGITALMFRKQNSESSQQ